MKTTTKLLLLLVVIALLFMGWFLHDRYTGERQLKALLGSNINSKNTSFDHILKLESASFETFVFDYSHDDDLIGFVKQPVSFPFPGNPEKLLSLFNLSGIWVLRTDMTQVFALCAPDAPDLKNLTLSSFESKRTIVADCKPV